VGVIDKGKGKWRKEKASETVGEDRTTRFWTFINLSLVHNTILHSSVLIIVVGGLSSLLPLTERACN